MQVTFDVNWPIRNVVASHSLSLMKAMKTGICKKRQAKEKRILLRPHYKIVHRATIAWRT